MKLELEDFLFDCEYRKLSPKTLKSYKNIITDFLLYCKNELEIEKISRIKSVHVKHFLKSKIDKGCKSGYINVLKRNLKVFFNFCEQEEYIVKNPMNNIKTINESKEIKIIFNDEEVQRIINYFDLCTFLNARNKTMLSLFFDTGVRCSELIDIKLKDVEKDRILINGKGNKQRFVSLSVPLKKYINRYLKIRKAYDKTTDSEFSDNLFISRTGQALTVSAIEHIFKKVKKECKIREKVRCSPHTARHYFAVKSLEINKNIHVVSRLLGHASVRVSSEKL
ncbi:tyrosine-type recombinase/integrase [Crassaminicella indica]|uniref:Tyrosine-type recombinase/integrase n=1 Tax=Crassaminicella indica TaxID=2855394 RepID=A0ABX8RE40_9CLOT|nr:tyrosine-type recombinase/integrase [Crassaminicella indica]QXM06170.1 tyrosine-type recombinase/integrase [Crassaminicella indica]